ncbi:MAG: hypothetical protein ACOYXC_07060 [Candidatus Rifleibacteriota bacterium]
MNKTLLIRGLAFILMILSGALAFAEKVSFTSIPDAEAKAPGRVLIAFKAERTGNFLAEPGNVPIEFLRRAGREINKNWQADEKQLEAASVFEEESFGQKDFLKPKKLIELSSGQQKDAKALIDRYSSEADELLQEIKPNDNCILMKMAAETEPIIELLKSLIEKKQSVGRLREDQIFKIQHQVLPMLECSDYLIGAAILSDQGFEARLRIKSLSGRLADPRISHSISIGKFINHDALMFFAQTHPVEDPSELMKSMLEIPQTSTVISMVASAGLDFEKDLLANSARESIFYVNLEPTEDSGLPDLRFVAPVPDIKKLESNLEKLKTLCVQSGIFVKNLEGKTPGVRLSHFMFPQYGVFAALCDEFLVLASTEEKLYEEIDFLRSVKAGKPSSDFPNENLQRFWRINFSDFNLQLQKLLQSPLMADKGVPPIPNLAFLNDLDDMKILTRLEPDRLDLSMLLPIKENKEK